VLAIVDLADGVVDKPTGNQPRKMSETAKPAYGKAPVNEI
jgi:hypothetical protein